ncbi:hypothetical protein DFH28DRAFT_1161813 [Melampsora americana]|nr:hypothetical protein DFH28DRAFT_1161813 [Melampsora americana]
MAVGTVVEKRTVKTRGTFFFDEMKLRSSKQENKIVATVTEQDEHRIHEPHRLPAEHTYRTTCPHEFRLSRRKAVTPTGLSSSSRGEELVVHLSDLVYEMYANWTMSWEFSFKIEGYGRSVPSEVSITPQNYPIEWKTFVVDQSGEMLDFLARNYNYSAELKFTVTWSRQEESLNSTYRELDVLRKAMTQMRTTIFKTYKSPSVDITRLIFCSKGSGTVKKLYVPSHILTQFEYFRRCHSAEYSETQDTDKSQLEMDQTPIPNEGLYNDDSDEEWDSDSDNFEPEKDVTFKATIYVRGTARRTYQAFVDYAICGSVVISNLKHEFQHWRVALHLAPLRSAYRKYCETLSSPASTADELPGQLSTPWPEWAEAHHTPHTVVPGFKTLSSPKSLYRLADMLIIPELKEICHRQIMHSLNKSNVISELQSPLFEQHQELRLTAYKKIHKDWRLFSGSELVPLITYLLEEEAVIIVNYILENP